MVGNRTMLSIAQEICPRPRRSSAPGPAPPTGDRGRIPQPHRAKGVKAALPNLTVPVVNVPGCPPNPVNVVGVIADYLLQNRLPALDSKGRPRFAYGRKVHELCPYREQESRCLKEQGCKGERCFNNCPSVKFNDGVSFPMQAGHPCIGCSEPNFWDTMTPFYGKATTIDGRSTSVRLTTQRPT